MNSNGVQMVIATVLGGLVVGFIFGAVAGKVAP